MHSEMPDAIDNLSLRAIDINSFSWSSRLARIYCSDFTKLESFYAWDPSDPASLLRSCEARQTAKIDTTQISSVVFSQLKKRSAPTTALKNAEKLCDPRTVAVVTGQQAGLFGGPFFTLLKAITAISLSKKFEADNGIPTVPIFWIDSEDHDLEEVNKCSVLNKNLDLNRLELNCQSTPEQPVSTVSVGDNISDVLNELWLTLPETEFSENLRASLSKCYKPSSGLAQAFADWLDLCLGDEGIVAFDSSDKSAKTLARAVFTNEIEHSGRTSKLATTAGTELSELGYHSQVVPSDQSTALFKIEQKRELIRMAGNDFVVGGAKQTAATLNQKITDTPELFSPSVLLRPIVQDTLFPTIAYIAGPNELAYLGQLRKVYESFKVPMPVIYPRISATVIDRASEKFLSKNNLSLDSLEAQDDRLLNNLVRESIPSDLEEALNATEKDTQKNLLLVSQKIVAVDQTLAGATKTTISRIERDLQTLRTKIIQAAKRNDETLKRQLQRTRAQAFPNGEPQEREISFVYFLNRYGPEIIGHLLKSLPLDVGKHWLLKI